MPGTNLDGFDLKSESDELANSSLKNQSQWDQRICLGQADEMEIPSIILTAGSHSPQPIRNELQLLPPELMHTQQSHPDKSKPSLRERLMSHLVQSVPDDIAQCEFNCSKADCSHTEWCECKRRLDSLDADGQPLIP